MLASENLAVLMSLKVLTQTRPPKEFSKPVILLFIQGFGCSHCVEQLVAFGSELSLTNIAVLCITPDEVLDDPLPPFPFPALSDPNHVVFRHFGAFDGEPKHATILLDSSGERVWGRIGEEPFRDLDFLRSRVDELK